MHELEHMLRVVNPQLELMRMLVLTFSKVSRWQSDEEWHLLTLLVTLEEDQEKWRRRDLVIPARLRYWSGLRRKTPKAIRRTLRRLERRRWLRCIYDRSGKNLVAVDLDPVLQRLPLLWELEEPPTEERAEEKARIDAILREMARSGLEGPVS